MKINFPISFSFYKCNLKLFFSFILYSICIFIIFFYIYTISFTEKFKEIIDIFQITGNITGVITGKLNDKDNIELDLNKNLTNFEFNDEKEYNIKGIFKGTEYINEEESYDIKNGSVNAIIYNNNSSTKIFGLISFLIKNNGFIGKFKKEYKDNYYNKDEFSKFRGEKYILKDIDFYSFSFVVNRIIYNLIINFGQILTIFFVFCQFKSKKKKGAETKDITNNDDESSVTAYNYHFRFIYNDNSHLFKLSKLDIIFLILILISTIPIPFAELYLSQYTLVPTYESFFIYIMIIIVIIFIQKEKLYKHQKLSIFATILLGIPEIIINTMICFKKEEDDNEDSGDDEYIEESFEEDGEEEYEEEDYYGYWETAFFNQTKVLDFSIYPNETFEENIFIPDDTVDKHPSKIILWLLIKIYLAAHFVFTILFKRRLMEHYFFSPLKVSYLFGFFN